MSCLLSILFYTNWDELCKNLRLSFYKKQPPKKAGYYNKDGQYCYPEDKEEGDGYDRYYCGDSIPFYFFGSFLYIAVEYYGTGRYSLKKKDKHDTTTYYHGLSCKMTFDTLSTEFCSPTSVTSSLRVAKQFAKDNGIILILKPMFKGPHNYTKYMDVECISDYIGEEERIYFGWRNHLLITDIISQPNNYELGKYECVCFETYFNPFNWFGKVTRGYSYGRNSKYYNLSSLEFEERKILNRIICNYLGRKKYNIPKYIETLFKHYCIHKKGHKCDEYDGDDTWDSKPLSYISFNGINSDSSIFGAFRSHFFYDFDLNQISPKKLRNVFINCNLFYDQEFNEWQLKNGIWYYKKCIWKGGYDDDFRDVRNVEFMSEIVKEKDFLSEKYEMKVSNNNSNNSDNDEE